MSSWTAVPTGPQNDAGGSVVIKLGIRLDNARKQAGKLAEQRRADLGHLGMRR
ncbi:hypothetical protein [Streptomyces sanglieri]|uniref:hypothetical protein n=1 Tax=Streptomyces sanglieri TaxID=193460 RepID=UPI00352532D2